MNLTHGLGSTYRTGGCRCDPCRQAQRADQRAYRAAHPELREYHRIMTALYRRQRRWRTSLLAQLEAERNHVSDRERYPTLAFNDLPF